MKAGELGCLLDTCGREDNAAFAQGFVRMGFEKFFVSGTWQLWASTDGEDNGRQESAMIERGTRDNASLLRESLSRRLVVKQHVLKEVGRFGRERMSACRISRPRKSIMIYERQVYDKLEALTESISVSTIVHILYN